MSEVEGRKRAKYLKLGEGSHVGGGAPGGGAVANDRAANDTAPAFTVTRGELAALVREAAAAAVAEALGNGLPTAQLLDRGALSLALGCSPSLVDKMRQRGMPHLRLGDSPRFELERCLEWIRKDGAA